MSTINLTKGGNLSLTKTSPNSKHFRVGLGWNVKNDSTIKDDIDIDVMAIPVDGNDKGADPNKIVFYNNVDGNGNTSDKAYGGMTPAQSLTEAKRLNESSMVVVSKDNRDGNGDGDDETLFVNGSLLSDNQKVKICINIYEAASRKQVFGMVSGAYAKVYDDMGTEICKYDLGEDFSLETGVIAGEFYKKDGELKFKALGTGFNGDLNQLVSQFQ